MVELIKKIIYSYLDGCNDEIKEISKDEYFILKYHKMNLLLSDMTDHLLLDSSDMDDLLNNKNSNEEKNLLYLTEILKINHALNEKKIKYVFLKGCAMIICGYKKIYHRVFNDIDILISPYDIDSVENVLLNSGYVQGDIVGETIVPAKRKDVILQKLQTHEIYNMTKKHSNGAFTKIDVNFMFMWREFENMEFPFDKILPNIKLIEIANQMLPILGYDLQFIHSSIHFYNEAFYFTFDIDYKHHKDPHELRLFRLVDIIILIHKQHCSIANINKLVSELNCIHKIEFVLSLIALIMGREFIASFLNDFNVTEDIPNYFFTKSGKKVEWPITICKRLFDLDSKIQAVKLLSEDGYF